MTATLDLQYPFTGRWLVGFSPADRVPSHGTTAFATSHAMDFTPLAAEGTGTPIPPSTLMRPEPLDRFPGFGRELLAPIAGVVVAAHQTEPDHEAYRGTQSIKYALTQRERLQRGWVGLAGNHVFIDAGGVVVALCHLQQSSVSVRVGQRVTIGELVGRCGNSGNSTEPHLHLQAMDGADVERAGAVPFTLNGGLPHRGEVVDISG